MPMQDFQFKKTIQTSNDCNIKFNDNRILQHKTHALKQVMHIQIKLVWRIYFIKCENLRIAVNMPFVSI